MKIDRVMLLCSAASVSQLVSSGAAWAQTAEPPATVAASAGSATPSDQLGDIIVTAQRQSQNLQNVPLSVTALSGDALASRGITTIQEVGSLTPGLQITGGNGVVQPFLRGIGSTANALGNESSVAVYMDGLYFTRLPVGFLSLNNVERVEVLKGPQGTLFGRNSSGGVIQIITPSPSFDTKLSASLGYGNFNTLRGDFNATGKLAEGVAADLSINGQRQKDGWGRNIITGDRNGYLDYFTARGKLLLEPTDKTRVLLTGFYSYSKTPSPTNTFPGTTQGYESAPFLTTPFLTLTDFYGARSNINGNSTAKAIGGTATIEQELSFAHLTSISGYIHTTDDLKSDSDYLDRTDFHPTLNAVTNQFTQELRLSNIPGSPVKWTAGLFYYNTLSEYKRIRFVGLALFPPAFVDTSSVNIFSRQRATSYAAYAQASYEILPRMTATGGLRYSIDKLRGRGSTNIIFGGAPFGSTLQGPARDTVKRPSYRAALDYQLTDRVMIFGSISEGYKSASFNLIPFTGPATKPEILTAYEVGFKSELLDHRVRINASAFWYDVKDPQVQLYRAGSITLSNAESARSRGFDVDAEALITTGLSTHLSFSYIDSKYRRYSNAPSNPPIFVPPFGASSPPLAINASGNYTPFAPKITFAAGANYKFATSIGEFNVGGDYSYNDGYSFEPDNVLHQPRFGLFNANVIWTINDQFSVKAWGKNLSGKKYVLFAASQEGPAGFPFLPGAPRTYGLDVMFKF